MGDWSDHRMSEIPILGTLGAELGCGTEPQRSLRERGLGGICKRKPHGMRGAWVGWAL